MIAQGVRTMHIGKDLHLYLIAYEISAAFLYLEVYIGDIYSSVSLCTSLKEKYN